MPTTRIISAGKKSTLINFLFEVCKKPVLYLVMNYPGTAFLSVALLFVFFFWKWDGFWDEAVGVGESGAVSIIRTMPNVKSYEEQRKNGTGDGSASIPGGKKAASKAYELIEKIFGGSTIPPPSSIYSDSTQRTSENFKPTPTPNLNTAVSNGTSLQPIPLPSPTPSHGLIFPPFSTDTPVVKDGPPKPSPTPKGIDLVFPDMDEKENNKKPTPVPTPVRAGKRP